MEGRQSYERVVGTLIRQIFARHLKPGEKLPPERQLAKDLHVDRASLRVALKLLESLNVLTIRQGDGIYVRDYMKSASIDFLRILFQQDTAADQEWLADEYILDEVWEFWIAMLPEMLKLAAKRFTFRDLKALMDIFDAELANLDDLPTLVELEAQSQELIAEIANNIVFLLLSHTCRPLRRRMIEIFYRSITVEQIKGHVELKKALVRDAMREPDQGGLTKNIEQYRELLSSHRQLLRKVLFEEREAAAKAKA